MKYDVFISYSRKDYADENKQVLPGNVISKIKDLFAANGISYWFDEDGVYSGDAFAPVLARTIKESKIFLFISSENSNASEWTSNEIATAHAYKKKIIPFRYDNSVYNDSVIIYIARLDYIDYQTNPELAFTRLLSSVQEFLRKEVELEEQERLEEERRRNEEISKQERAIKLQSLREKIGNLEKRKLEIEKEILTQEKSLRDLRNEKRIVESNIIDLQEEEAILLGSQIVQNKLAESINSNDVSSRTLQNIEKKQRKQGLFAREWGLIKTAASQRHGFVNFLYIIMLLVTIGVVIRLSYYEYPVVSVQTHGSLIAMSLAAFIALLAMYRLMKNNWDGILWAVLSIISINCVASLGGVDYSYWELGEYEYGGCTATEFLILNYGFLGLRRLQIYIAIYCLIMLLCMFIRKNGLNVWQVMQRNKNPFWKDRVFFIPFCLSFVLMIILTCSNLSY